MNNTPDNQKSSFRAPSARVTAALAAAMLGIGVAVGAAIGPAPSPSEASSSLPGLLATLARAAAARAAAAQQASNASTQPTASTAEAAPARKRRKRVRKAASSEEATSAATTTPTSETETTAPAATKPKSTTKTSTLAPITHVWLIELAGPSFAQALAQPAAAPYIDTEAIAAGTLLSGWSGIDGSGFATDAALVAGSPPQLLDTIAQPPCPASSPEGEGAAGAACTSEAGELTTADEFLKATIPTITSSAAFRESGLIVVTFASVASATETGLPAGATTATLTSQPPAGVLLISPFVGVGAKSAASFNPTSPKQSLEKLLRR
jgi:hypothetical protein